MFSFSSRSTAAPPQPKATIELLLDSSNFIAGSSITGRVVLTVFAEQIAEESIFLEVSGNERATYVSRESPYDRDQYSSNQYNQTRTYSSDFKILDTTFPLAICPGGFRQGQHTFSINFLLPANLPPSFSYSGIESGDNCSVYYSLKAFLDSRSRGNTPGGFHRKQFGIISPYIAMVPVATCLPVNENRINYLGCYCSGSINFGAFLPNSVICAGEALDIYYVIENNSKSKVLELSVSIEGTLKYNADSYRRVHPVATVHQIVTETQLDLSPKTPSETSGKTIDELNRDLVSGSCRKISVAIPQSALASIKGKGGFVNVDYQIVLKVRTSWGYTKPILTSGLTVHRNGLQPINVKHNFSKLPQEFADAFAQYDQQMASIY